MHCIIGLTLITMAKDENGLWRLNALKYVKYKKSEKYLFLFLDVLI